MHIEGRFIAIECGNMTTFFKDGLPKLSVTKTSPTETCYTTYAKGVAQHETFRHDRGSFANPRHRQLDIERLKLAADCVIFTLDRQPASRHTPVYLPIKGCDGLTWLEHATLLVSFSPSGQSLGVWNVGRARHAASLGYLFSLTDEQAA